MGHPLGRGMILGIPMILGILSLGTGTIPSAELSCVVKLGSWRNKYFNSEKQIWLVYLSIAMKITLFHS